MHKQPHTALVSLPSHKAWPQETPGFNKIGWRREFPVPLVPFWLGVMQREDSHFALLFIFNWSIRSFIFFQVKLEV
jgi:hypothetical protein